MTHFRRGGGCGSDSEATPPAEASDWQRTDGAGAGRWQPSKERAGGQAPPPPRPSDLHRPGGGRWPGGSGGGFSGAMFVQEEKIFAGKVLRLHICATDGTEWLEEATEDTSVEKLKERCLKHVRQGGGPGPCFPGGDGGDSA